MNFYKITLLSNQVLFAPPSQMPSSQVHSTTRSNLRRSFTGYLSSASGAKLDSTEASLYLKCAKAQHELLTYVSLIKPDNQIGDYDRKFNDFRELLEQWGATEVADTSAGYFSDSTFSPIKLSETRSNLEVQLLQKEIRTLKEEKLKLEVCVRFVCLDENSNLEISNLKS